MAARISIRHRYPWTQRALRALERLSAEPHSYRYLAQQLKARKLTKDLPDAAVVRRAVLRRKAVR
jgi:uncharacterized protein (DUF1800 family)